MKTWQTIIAIRALSAETPCRNSKLRFPILSNARNAPLIFDGGNSEAIRYEIRDCAIEVEYSRWKYKLIETVEVLQEMVDMMNSGDEHGTGRTGIVEQLPP